MSLGRLAEIAAWAAVCLGIWVLTLSTITAKELMVAGAASVVCALAAAGGRQLVDGRWTVRPSWLRWLPQLCVSAPIETVKILWAALRRQRGSLVTVQLPSQEPQKVSASRRAIGTVLLSASPGSYVVDSEPDERVIHIHRLGGRAPERVQIDPGTR